MQYKLFPLQILAHHNPATQIANQGAFLNSGRLEVDKFRNSGWDACHWLWQDELLAGNQLLYPFFVGFSDVLPLHLITIIEVAQATQNQYLQGFDFWLLPQIFCGLDPQSKQLKCPFLCLHSARHFSRFRSDSEYLSRISASLDDEQSNITIVPHSFQTWPTRLHLRHLTPLLRQSWETWPGWLQRQQRVSEHSRQWWAPRQNMHTIFSSRWQFLAIWPFSPHLKHFVDFFLVSSSSSSSLPELSSKSKYRQFLPFPPLLFSSFSSPSFSSLFQSTSSPSSFFSFYLISCFYLSSSSFFMISLASSTLCFRWFSEMYLVCSTPTILQPINDLPSQAVISWASSQTSVFRIESLASGGVAPYFLRRSKLNIFGPEILGLLASLCLYVSGNYASFTAATAFPELLLLLGSRTSTIAGLGAGS